MGSVAAVGGASWLELAGVGVGVAAVGVGVVCRVCRLWWRCFFGGGCGVGSSSLVGALTLGSSGKLCRLR